MPLKKKPVTGMKDILPREMEIRNYVMNLIKETYGMFGFVNIETPCVEHIENLQDHETGREAQTGDSPERCRPRGWRSSL